ncbi:MULTISPECIES: beta-ketoacyl-ACP synthase III [Empedobacter]|uniref:beta-ketoacyl-ACP synthase III n=1 Tax=Empedobacter TaxID=59734 RepID=UPI00244C343D|nr:MULTISPECIES: beta-ketoacyl-ACP synthase III [unclassified Empedobacter]MDH0659727.1 beta-ketoacyl-ACP synthase III [Empedobacter sp. GD03865]
MQNVYITKTSKFLPNQPISNEEMEDFLGKINQIPSKARRIVLRNNGIKTRYYALDKTGNVTHSNAELTSNAITNLFDTQFTKNEVEVLSCGTSTPDLLLPSHAAMVHGLLQNSVSVELNSSSGVCNSGMNALKFGYLSVKSGNSKNAVCSGSERVSTWMKAEKFEHEVENLKELEEQPIIAFKKDFLRWMLSDGAAAFLLQNQPNEDSISLKIEWMESYSYAHELETCMYAGGDKLPNGEMKSWSDFSSEEWLKESVFSLKQDVKVLNDNILIKGVESMKAAMDKHQLSSNEIDYLLPHVSSNYFVQGLYDEFCKRDIYIPLEKWFMNLSKVGNVGSASVFLMLDELFQDGNLKKGDRIMLCVPESGRFSYSYVYLTVV